ncbi:hypothetical protein D0Z00_004665 [Geotrichum galactomycetum]|uniref:Uncharacterized protein n=1 Tax=Geotrichum galactomycetum TaxID=27317 RepID=A0ACB6UXS8_9ASCO|nr:hypothetical protein D0Z00_004665 [Geotrichum candidum]
MDMDMTHTSSSVATATSTAATLIGAGTGAPLATMAASSSDAACTMNMLWNWNTINSCFLAKSWHITSNGGFAATCVGVVFLTMLVELVRRLQREYDRFIVARWRLRKEAGEEFGPDNGTSTSSLKTKIFGHGSRLTLLARQRHLAGYTPSWTEQAVRSLFYLLQFAGAYFLMLLAMYYNGYIIICIFIGGYLGNLFFGADSFRTSGQDELGDKAHCC